MAPGNDDHFEVDQVIEDSAAIVNCNNKNVMVSDHEMIAFFVGQTQLPGIRHSRNQMRSLSPCLEALISTCARISQMRYSISMFLLIGYALDLAPELTKDLGLGCGSDNPCGQPCRDKDD